MTDLDSYRWLMDIAVGGVSSIAGWLAGRKQKDNSFLRELQDSINTLAAKNAEQMEEIIKLRDQIVTLREENLELSKGQERLLRENSELKEEVAKLREDNSKQSEIIRQLQQKLEGVKTITRTK